MHGRVETATWVTPAMVRLVLGGEGLDDFAMPDSTDAYINIALPPSGAPYGPVFDPKRVRESEDAQWWPARRRYTVRAWHEAARRLTVDFVVHGDTGVAGPWAASATAGDVLVFEGPSGGYRPDPTADWHLMVGDESALPAILASLPEVPAGSRVVVRLLCDGPEHELPVEDRESVDVQWLHRAGEAEPRSLLLRSLEDLSWPEGRVHAFVHGEAEEIRDIRRHLLTERGVTRADMSCSPYWRRTMSDEAWRAVKKDFIAAMEADAG